MLSSDSEDDKHAKNKKPAKKETLKPISALEAFGSTPIKQTKIPERPKNQEPPSEVPQKSKKAKKSKWLAKESGIHGDEAFEKTLLELDEDFLMESIDELDKTIDEALCRGKKLEESQVANDKTTNKISVENRNKESLIEVSDSGSDDFEKQKISKDKKQKVIDKKGPTPDKVTIESTPKKNKSNSSSNTPKTPNTKPIVEDYDGDPDELRHEKKRHSAILYQKYLNRSGPAHHGSKELPKGKPDCLKDLCFICTGVLDSLEKEEFGSLIKECGGRVVQSVSKKVNYLVAGEDPGPAKLEKAKNYNIPIISEDDLLDLIRTKSGLSTKRSEDTNVEKQQERRSPKKLKLEAKPHLTNEKQSNSNDTKSKPTPITNSNLNKVSINSTKSISASELKESLSESLSWTEKHKPTTIKSIIGQQGDKSNMKRLITWLGNWYKNHSGKNKPKLSKPSPWATNDDGSYFKAALLSGPPGVGKTTTATLVAKELGFDAVEFNASDTRSKKLLHEEVSQLLSTKSLAGFFTDGSAPTNKHVLLMDEVDGMAGNEDRGGIQELILLIKNSNVPIICMCNDRNHQKMRSLGNYCLDLRFSRPKLEQIKGAMMSVCFKEGIKISSDALAEVITGAGMDIRQILTHLSIWSAGAKELSAETASKEAKIAIKDTPLGQWEVCRKVFSADEHKTMSIGDRSRLFYHDYSLAPLFVQENYLKVLPHAPKNEHLAGFAAAADAISMGDIIDTKIRRTNNWSLLDVEAMCASVLPGHYVEGHMAGQIGFPSWLGKNSKKNKFGRLLSELQAHMRTSISGSRIAVNLDYITHLRNKIVRPLAKEGAAGIDEALEVMHAYRLLRDDFDGILELALWPRQKDPMNMVESKVKAAFTRAYNKENSKLPYAVQMVPVKKKSPTSSQNEEYEEEEDTESNHEDDEDVTKDAMIKLKKPSSKGSIKESKSSAGTSKQGGKGAQPIGKRGGSKKK